MTDAPLSAAVLRTLTPVQAAARWITCEERDEPLFKQWLADSADNRAAWGKAQLAWGVFDSAADDAMISAMARSARHAGPVVPDAELDIRREPANDRGGPRLFAAAAAIVLMASAILFGLHGQWFGKAPPAVIAATDQSDPLTRFGKPDYITGKHQTTIVDLPDGTRVTLAPESALDLAYADGRRRSRLLHGRGYFDVAHDAAHPFAVEAAGRVVTALGTRFDIAVTPQRVRIVLAQGSVSVATAPGGPAVQAPVTLRPGQVFTAAPNQPGSVRAADLDRDLDWRQKFVAIDDRPLSEVIATLNLSTRAQLFIRDPAVAAMRITAQFRTGDIERFGRALAIALPVRIVARGAERYEIVRRR